MAEYINQKSLLTRLESSPIFNNFGEDGLFIKEFVLELIQRQPTEDVVEVVRCKDCVSSRPLNRNDRFEARYSDGCIYCSRTDEGVAKDDYCSYGERSENGN